MLLCWICQNFTVFKYIVYTSQGNVATYLVVKVRWENDNILLQIPASAKVKEILRSANTWQSYERIISLLFFDSLCSITEKLWRYVFQ